MISLKMKPRDVSRALELLGLTTDVWAPLRAVKSYAAAEVALKTVKKSIHEAFRSRARELHPDHGGDEQDFQIVSELKARVENLKLQRPARATPARPQSNMPFDQRWADMLRQQRERDAARRAQRVVVVNMEDFFDSVFAATGVQRPKAKQSAPKQRSMFTDGPGHDGQTLYNDASNTTLHTVDEIRRAHGLPNLNDPPPTSTKPRHGIRVDPDPRWNDNSRSVIEDLMDAMRVAQGFPPKSGTGNK